jgi:hypothetical protein
MTAAAASGSAPAIQTKTVNFSDFISPTEELIEEARSGRMFILVDDEDRENEGDLVIPAQFATPAAINHDLNCRTRDEPIVAAFRPKDPPIRLARSLAG